MCRLGKSSHEGIKHDGNPDELSEREQAESVPEKEGGKCKNPSRRRRHHESFKELDTRLCIERRGGRDREGLGHPGHFSVGGCFLSRLLAPK